MNTKAKPIKGDYKAIINIMSEYLKMFTIFMLKIIQEKESYKQHKEVYIQETFKIA